VHDLTTPSTRRVLGSTAAALLLALGLAACGDSTAETTAETTAQTATETTAETTPETATPAVVVGDPWVRATRGTEDPSMTAAFMTLDNAGTEDVALVAASSSVARTAELHEMAVVDGTAVMQPVAGGIPLAAGRGKLLEPGGYHVMLMGLRDPLSPGDEVDLVLEFSDGSTQELTVPVKEFTEEEGHYHAPGTGDHDH
jgi:copper(I)-binding protein